MNLNQVQTSLSLVLKNLMPSLYLSTILLSSMPAVVWHLWSALPLRAQCDRHHSGRPCYKPFTVRVLIFFFSPSVSSSRSRHDLISALPFIQQPSAQQTKCVLQYQCNIFFLNISANQQVPLFFGHFNAITGLTNFSILHDLHWFWRTNWSFCLCGFQLKRKQNFTKHYLYRTSHPLIAISFVLCIWKPCWNIIVIVLLS